MASTASTRTAAAASLAPSSYSHPNPAHHPGGFDGIDADGGGRISRAELASSLAGSKLGSLALDNLFLVADADGDGSITKEEMLTASLLLPDTFLSADADGDKLVSRDEMAAYVKASLGESRDGVADGLADKFDADHDGFVSQEEFSAQAKASRAEADIQL